MNKAQNKCDNCHKDKSPLYELDGAAVCDRCYGEGYDDGREPVIASLSVRDISAGVGDHASWAPGKDEQRAWLDNNGKFHELPQGTEHDDYAEAPGDSVIDGIEAGWSRLYFDGYILAIDLGEGASAEWVLDQLASQKRAWLLPHRDLIVDSYMTEVATVPIDEGEDAIKAWKNRNSIRKRVASRPLLHNASQTNLWEAFQEYAKAPNASGNWTEKLFWKGDYEGLTNEAIQKLFPNKDADSLESDEWIAVSDFLFNRQLERIKGGGLPEISPGGRVKIWRCIDLADPEHFMGNIHNEQSMEEYDGIGIFWSYIQDAAECHWGGEYQAERGQRKGKIQVTLAGEVEFQDIDIEKTVEANMDPKTGLKEKELTLKPGAPIYITDIIPGPQATSKKHNLALDHPIVIKASKNVRANLPTAIKGWINAQTGKMVQWTCDWTGRPHHDEKMPTPELQQKIEELTDDELDEINENYKSFQYYVWDIASKEDWVSIILGGNVLFIRSDDDGVVKNVLSQLDANILSQIKTIATGAATSNEEFDIPEDMNIEEAWADRKRNIYMQKKISGSIKISQYELDYIRWWIDGDNTLFEIGEQYNSHGEYLCHNTDFDCSGLDDIEDDEDEDGDDTNRYNRETAVFQNAVDQAVKAGWTRIMYTRGSQELDIELGGRLSLEKVFAELPYLKVKKVYVDEISADGDSFQFNVSHPDLYKSYKNYLRRKHLTQASVKISKRDRIVTLEIRRLNGNN